MSGEILQSQLSKPKSWMSQQWAKYKMSVQYLLGFILLFNVWNLLAPHLGNRDLFIVSQIGYCLLGILHYFLFYWMLTWAQKKSLAPWKESEFTILLTALALLFICIKISIHRPILDWGDDKNLLLSPIPFIIPFLIMKAWDFWEAIPERVYKTWQYPVGMKPPVIQPQKNALTLNFRIVNSSDGTLYKEPFPYEMDIEKTLGDHLHFYLFVHNAKYTGDKTIFISDPVTNIPYQWSYCTYSLLNQIVGGQRVIDFSVPVKNLNLKTGMLVEVQKK